MQQSTAPWCLFNSSMRKADCINVALEYLPLEAINEKLSKEEALLNCWDRSWIQGFGNTHGIRVIAKLDSVTYWAEPPEKLEGIKKDKIALERLGLMVRLDGI